LCGSEAAHPLTLGLRLHNAANALDTTAPPLARLVCISPFDAAIHDAVGHAVGRSSFDLYEEPLADPDLAGWFEGADAAGAIRQVLHPPVDRLDAWLVVGKDDTQDEVTAWIRRYGYRCFKLKLQGRDAAEDVKRTRDIYWWAREAGSIDPRIAIDSNCANPDSASVLEYLERLQHDDPETYAALQYVEQPTGRDIARYPFDWREVGARKPVMLDEGAVSLEALREAREQNWSGVAIKTCRGHSFALLSAAWAHRHGMLLAMQDLTNPGIAAVHSALLGARLPVINGIELNSLQYIPEANADLLPRLQSLFEPQEGRHHLPPIETRGLGSNL
jgi:L-alanine-DL-glutamate epimerase-like enolase superfamily enzyme